MVKYFGEKYALTEQGSKDLIKGICSSTLANISLMFPIGLILLAIQEFLKPLIDGTTNEASVFKYIGLSVLLLTVIFICHWVQYGHVFTCTYSESANRRVTIAEKLRKLPLSFFGQRDLSDLTSTMMSDCTELEHTFSHSIPELFGASISTILMGIALFCVNVKMAVALLWVVPIAFTFIIATKKLQDKMSVKNIEAKRACSDEIQECLETVRDIKACNQEKIYLKNLDNTLKNGVKIAISTELITGVFVTFAQMILKLGMAVTVLVGAKLLINSEIDIFTYFMFLLAATRVYEPLNATLINLAAVFAAELQIERMKSIENEKVQEGKEKYKTNGYDIVFDHVAFSYNGNENVLNDVSFTAKQGEVTALVGPSGGGKSTATKLAARFWDVTKGKILLGGVDISEINPESLLSSYSIVFQDVTLFNDTIMENIRLGRRGASDEEVLKAAKAAKCDGFVSGLPKGYQTEIGENGGTLSGGERQRLSIARALLKDAPVILLDEATASLDVENETEIQKAISALVKNKTVLVIAHRMRTVSGADKIVVLENGTVAQQGSADKLWSEGGLYRHMVEIQQESDGWTLQNN